MDYETQIMELIVNSGDARGKALEAVSMAEEGRFDAAKEQMAVCTVSLNKAHNIQTELIQAELNGEEKVQTTLLMVHAQDHLMNAITVKEMAEKMIDLTRLIYEKFDGNTEGGH